MDYPHLDFELTYALAALGEVGSLSFDHHLKNLVNLLDLYATGDLLRSIIKDQLSKLLVFPNKLDIKLKSDQRQKTHQRHSECPGD
jgi:hypothetical protein